MALRGTVVALLLCAAVLFHETGASAGPPAAAPPDLETLKRLSESAEPVRVRRVVITKKTTEATTPMTTTEEPTKTEAEKTKRKTTGSTEHSDFADPDFSGEKTAREIKTEENTTAAVKVTTVSVTTEVTTEATKEKPATEEPLTTTAEATTTEVKTTKRRKSKPTTTTTEATTTEGTTTEVPTTVPGTTEANTTEVPVTQPTEVPTTTERKEEDDSIVATMKVGRRRVIIRKQPKTTTEASTTEVPTTTKRLKQLPQDDDHLSPIEEMKLLKKLAKQGIAFGVRNKELELIHNQNGELDLPPFAFSEDDNSVTEEPTEEETVQITDSIATSTTITTATTEAPSTTTENPENTEKELKKFEKEPFKVGTNIVPVRLFFNQNRPMRKRKRVRVSTSTAPTVVLTEETIVAETTTASVINEEAAKEATTASTVTVASSSTVSPTSITPRTDDFLVPIPEKMLESEEEKHLDSFSFPVAPTVERTTMKPVPKSKMPEKMILPSLLEMPKLSALSSFGSLSVPVHPTGVSQKIRKPHRVDSDAAAPPATIVKSRTTGKMRGQRKRRVMRKKTALGVVSHAVDRETNNRKGPVRVRFIGQAENLVAQHHKTQAKVIRSDDPAAAEQSFAESLKKPSSTMDLVVASLRKIKRTNRMILTKNKELEKRARAAGEKTVQATATASHDGQVRATRLAAHGEIRPAVIDRDFTRKTVDRDV